MELFKQYTQSLQQEMAQFATMCMQLVSAGDLLDDEDLDGAIDSLEYFAYLLGVGIDLSAASEAADRIEAAAIAAAE